MRRILDEELKQKIIDKDFRDMVNYPNELKEIQAFERYLRRMNRIAFMRRYKRRHPYGE